MKSLLAVLLLLAVSTATLAQTSSVPSLLSYQGRVTDSAGNAIGASTPTNRTIQFKFYTVATGGSPVYAESQVVTISGGSFSVLIGNGSGIAGLPGPSAPPVSSSQVSLPTVFTGPLYLGITVFKADGTPDNEISPRQQLVSSAYTFRAKVAEGLANGALTTAMFAANAVTVDQINVNAVTTAKIVDANIITVKIADGAVTTVKIADGAVTTAKHADSSISTGKIADGAVTSAKIADGTVTSADLADNSIQSIDIKDGDIQTVDLADGAVTNIKLGAGAVALDKLIAAVQQALCPVGTILPFAGDTAPLGWQICDGSAWNRTNNAALFAVIGTRFGFTDSSNFRVPDFRGRFLRGRDGGAGRDPDRDARAAMNTGGAVGDLVGSVQEDEFKSHNHPLPRDTGGRNNLQTTTDTSNSDEDISENSPSGYRGGNETRPKNANVNFIIKF